VPYFVRAGGFQAALVEQHRALSGGSGTRNRAQRAAPLSRLFHQITGGLNCTLVPAWIANDFYPDFAGIKDR
jgi:hypothetical protein